MRPCTARRSCHRPPVVIFDGGRWCSFHALILGDEPARRYAETTALRVAFAGTPEAVRGRASASGSLGVSEPVPILSGVAS